METRQPHQVGTLGEEAVRALTRLHSSKNSGSCFRLIHSTLPVFLIIFFSRPTGTFLAKHWGGSRDDIYLVGVVLMVAVSYFIRYAINRLALRKPEQIILKRGVTPSIVPTSPTQIQEGFLSRFIGLPLALGMAIFFLIVLVNANDLSVIGQILMASGCLFFFYAMCNSLEMLFFPQLQVDERGVQVKRRKLSWSQIHTVQIESDVQGDSTTRWKFFDELNRQKASVSLQDNTLPQQNQLIEALAFALAAQIEEFTSHTAGSPPKSLME